MKASLLCTARQSSWLDWRKRNVDRKQYTLACQLQRVGQSWLASRLWLAGSDESFKDDWQTHPLRYADTGQGVNGFEEPMKTQWLGA